MVSKSNVCPKTQGQGQERTYFAIEAGKNVYQGLLTRKVHRGQANSECGTQPAANLKSHDLVKGGSKHSVARFGGCLRKTANLHFYMKCLIFKY